MFGYAFAEPAATAQGAQSSLSDGGAWTSLLIMVGIFVVFYVILILPQKKQEKKLRAMVDALCVGDEIITIGGIYGKVVTVKDDTVTIESGPDRSKIQFAKSAIKTCLTTHDDKPEK